MRFFTNTVSGVSPRASRKPLLGLMAAVLAFGASTMPASAEPRNPLAPADNSAPAAVAPSLTVEQLGEALDPYGKNTMTNNSHTDYSIDVKRGKWTLNIIVSISPNGSVIWMTNSLTGMPDKVSVDALLNVLKKNNEIGPMFFSIAHGSLILSYPVPNANLTAAGLRQKVDALATTVVETEALWNSDTLAGNNATPAPANGGRNPLAR